MALISLISGIAAWTIVPILGGIIAVITGHLARKEIASSGGQLAGNNQATAGLVLGYVHLGVAFLCILTFMALAVLGPLWSIFAESFRQLR
ncbi:MAG: DUF4190 domain-containing protein [Chloroflexi bacterium]|nr:DUF4190 domain-containing protein [Chloroflexota bacterium]